MALHNAIWGNRGSMAATPASTFTWNGIASCSESLAKLGLAYRPTCVCVYVRASVCVRVCVNARAFFSRPPGPCYPYHYPLKNSMEATNSIFYVMWRAPRAKWGACKAHPDLPVYPHCGTLCKE